MSYCLNPACSQPQNPVVTFCQSCGKKLLLRERYRAVRQIGQGGFGKTFLAVDQDLPNKPACVIKQFSPQIQSASVLQKATELFEQEAVQLNILGKHPQIPELLAHFEQDGRLYLVQEYVKGRNLAEELAQDGAFSEAKIRELLVGLLPVLQYIHDNQVIHRDIKPENIIRRDDGKLFLVDFGAVKIVTGSTFFKMGTLIGSAEYAAPEQTRGKASFASDLYSLGVTCLHLLTNIEAIILFNDDEHKWVWQDYLISPINSSLTTVLDKMVERAINRRYQSASATLQALNTNATNQLNNNSNSKVPMQIPNTAQIPINSPQSPNIKIQVNPTLKTPPKKVSMGNKIGYEDESGRIISKLLFEDGWEFSEGLAAVQYNNLWGFIDEAGQFVIEPKFHSARSFGNGLARVFYHQDCFINKKGEVVIAPDPNQFKIYGDFHEGLAPIYLNSSRQKQNVVQYGFIDTNGHIVIEPQSYDLVHDFNNGLAKIKVGGKLGCIDKTGQIVVKPQFDSIDDCSNGLAIVKTDKKYGLIDKTGRIIMKPECDHISFKSYENKPYFKNGWGICCISKKHYLIDKTGQIIPKIELDHSSSDSRLNSGNVLVKIKSNEKVGLINESGQIVVKPELDDIYMLNRKEIGVIILDKKYGLFNKNGQIIIQPRFDRVYIQYHDETIRMILGGKYGVIDANGQIIIQPKFDRIDEFKEGLAAFGIDTKKKNYGLKIYKFGFLDKTGKVVAKPKFVEVKNFENGLAKVKAKNLFGEKWRTIDKTGQFID
jgi:serine/threonine protein kinase